MEEPILAVKTLRSDFKVEALQTFKKAIIERHSKDGVCDFVSRL